MTATPSRSRPVSERGDLLREVRHHRRRPQKPADGKAVRDVQRLVQSIERALAAVKEPALRRLLAGRLRGFADGIDRVTQPQWIDWDSDLEAK